MTTYYIDTNIFIDAIKQRKNRYGKDIGIEAQKMFYKSISCNFHIAISTWTLEELYNNYNMEDLKMLFTLLKKKIITIKHGPEDIEKAKKRSEDNFDDALHIILAEKAKVNAIITRNTVHFIKIGTELPILIPERT